MPWIREEKFPQMFVAIANLLKENEITCICGERLLAKNLKSREENSEYWVFAHCLKCEYDYNYEKIIRQWFRKTKTYQVMEEFKDV